MNKLAIKILYTFFYFVCVCVCVWRTGKSIVYKILFTKITYGKALTRRSPYRTITNIIIIINDVNLFPLCPDHNHMPSRTLECSYRTVKNIQYVIPLAQESLLNTQRCTVPLLTMLDNIFFKNLPQNL